MDIVNRDAATPFATKDTSLIREIVNPRNASLRNQSLAEATLLPGHTSTAHFHPRSEEIYYVLRGSAVMRLEDASSTLRAGDAVAIAPGCRHQIRNTGSDELVFLCCCAPAYSHEDTVLCESLFAD